MLYFAHLYCPCHTETLRLYDTSTWKPCIGLCGHTVCLGCIEENVHMACPICNQPDVFVNKTPNYVAIELIKDCRDNFWELMKNWWSGKVGLGPPPQIQSLRCALGGLLELQYVFQFSREISSNHDSGPCSRCSDQTHVFRICWTCDWDSVCITTDSGTRLKMYSDRDLLNLSRHVLCSECAINHHNGHRTINIERIKYSKNDIKMTTSAIILEMFQEGMDKISYTTECRLRHGRIESTRNPLIKLLRKLEYKEEGECGYFEERIKMELITKYIEDIDQKWKELTMFSVGGTQCECNRLYNKLTKTQTQSNYEYHFGIMCHSEIETFTPGCPLFFRSHLEKRLKLYEIIGEKPPEQVTPEPFNDRQCPLCVILDHSYHNQKPIGYYRQHWLEIVENIWKNELPPLSDFCCRCLTYLNHFRIGCSCGKREDYYTKNEGMDRSIEDRVERFRDYQKRMERRYRDRYIWNSCQKPDCLMNDPKFWKYEIIREVTGFLSRIMNDGCSHLNVSCQLKRVRLEFTARKVSRALNKIDLRKNSRAELNQILEEVDDALEFLENRKNIYEAETQAPMCECSKLWNKNQSMLKKLDKESYTTRVPYCIFESSMEKMAEYSWKEDIPGCPMDFGHGIVLDPIVLEELKNMDLEDSFETMKL
ncbi:hypothetical protein CAEBREN_04135 [Caenorhabditis brenneri]|uniref:RING-type domain-containing protein n=1 Tax=Caenorhabditis brenneri TaxID=135651 RepID=G0P5A2_CAEBE|nr:hypothetical protein CAEBREN_04135 [Caenorhabditis brenneri]